MHACHRHPWRGSCAVVAAILLSLTPLHAQQAWEPAPPYNVVATGMCAAADGSLLMAGKYNLYRSVDTGRSWMVVPSYLIDPQLPTTVLLRLQDGSILAGGRLGVQRSTTHGMTWTRTMQVNNSGRALAELADGTVLVGLYGQVQASTDRGQTWNARANVSIVNMSAYGRFVFAVFSNKQLHRSSDGGATWQQMTVGVAEINAVAVSSSGVFAVGDGVHVSADSGATWVRLGAAAVPCCAADVEVVADSLILVAHEQGLYRSSDTGRTWRRDVVASMPPSIDYPQARWDRLLHVAYLRGVAFAASGIHLHRSTDGGLSWSSADRNIAEHLAIARAVIGPGSSWVVQDQYGDVRFSRNAGATWRLTRSIATFSANFQMAASDSGHFFAPNSVIGIVKSIDTAKTWVPHHSPHTMPPFGGCLKLLDNGRFVSHYRSDISAAVSTDNLWTWYFTSDIPLGSFSLKEAYSGADTGRIYVTGETGGIWRSTTGGRTWLTAGLDSAIVNTLIVPTQTLLFAGTKGRGVYRSTTGGATWVQMNTGLTRDIVTALLMASPTQLFAGTDSAGVFRSNDSGRTWTPFNTGLDNLNVTVLALDSSRRLLAGTLGGMRRTVMMVPVELASFHARAGETAIHLRWSTATETNNAGFEIERRIDDHEGWQRISFIAGSGTSARGTEYAYDDPRTTLPAEAVRLRYRLRQIDHDGSVNLSPEVLVDLTRPARADIQLHPQPLPRQRRSIGLRLGDGLADATHLTVHDLLGRSVLQQHITPTVSTIDLPLPALPPGVYRIVVHTPTRTASHPLILE
jgi:photosystem II stability/assembly factor-like uncharacterized protein